jgi:hypothetical protein
VVVICKSKPEISTIVEAGLFLYEPFYADMTEERKEEVLEEFRTSCVIWGITVKVAGGQGGIDRQAV